MFSFLFVAGCEDQAAGELLAAACAVMSGQMPGWRADGRIETADLPEISGGFAVMVPRVGWERPLVDVHVDEDTAAVVYGSLILGEASIARALCGAYRRGGASAARRLEGHYGAVVVDRAKGETVVLGDVLGDRSLRYVHSGGMLLVSPHDLTLVATGRVDVTDVDLCSAAAVLALDNSTKSKSLLKGIEPVPPETWLRWRPGRLDQMVDQPFSFENRIAANDATALRDQNERILALARQQAAEHLAGRDEIALDLTAGQDSRAILALIRSISEPPRINAYCEGAPWSLDVRGARTVARAAGIHFSSANPSPVEPDTYLDNLARSAFWMNGATDAQRMVTARPVFPPAGVRVFGVPGECFRDPYPLGDISAWRDQPAVRCVSDFIFSRSRHRTSGLAFIRFHTLPFRDELRRSVRERVEQRLNDFAAFADDPHDIWSLFYLLEHIMIWGQMVYREPYCQHYWIPFGSPSLLAETFRFPAPIGPHCTLHRDAIRRFFPEAYRIPVNGRLFLFSETLSKAYKYKYYAEKAVMRLLGRFGSRTRLYQDKLRAHQDERGRFLAETLGGVVRERLTGSGSVGGQLFGDEGLDRLMAQFMAEPGYRHSLASVSLLLSIESFLQQARNVGAAAGLSHRG